MEQTLSTPHNSPTYDVEEPLSIDQYVRADLNGGRFEIGVVCGLEGSTVTIDSTNGYEVTVPRYSVRQAFLLILDLNGVLVARGRGCCIHRPYAKEFLDFAFKNFVVGVWTSGLRRSCDPIIESVMGKYKNRLLFTFYRDKCDETPTPNNPHGTQKNLQFLFDQYPASFHSVNTIIIDDSPEKCSHPDIALCPVPFKDPEAQKNDDGLKKVMEVLHEVLVLNSHFPLIRAAEERLAELQSACPIVVAEPPARSNQNLEEVSLWAYRLCCEYLQGHCSRERCPYRHEPDDGVSPCSRKGNCSKGHARRWRH